MPDRCLMPTCGCGTTDPAPVHPDPEIDGGLCATWEPSTTGHTPACQSGEARCTSAVLQAGIADEAQAKQRLDDIARLVAPLDGGRRLARHRDQLRVVRR